MTPLARVTSIKVKLGLLVAASSLVAAVVATLGRAAGVSPWLSIPVTMLFAVAVTQLLAVGMTSPLRSMTAAAKRMARGDYAVQVPATASDEVGELARAFNTMAHDLAAVDRQRRELVANVSHELRTPLAALCVVLENLADGVRPADPRALEVALGQAERLSRLVTDLLDLAKVDAGKAPLSPQPVSLSALLEAAVEEARANGRDVSYDLRVPASLVVHADPDRLSQLVANLFDNASRHSPAGGVVAVSADAYEPDRWRLEVRDQGPGVAPDDRVRVFEPFSSEARPASETGGGTGLGLAIARWVTDLHGGSIAFAEPPAGSTGARVVVELPLRPTDRPVHVPLAPALPHQPAPTEVAMSDTPAASVKPSTTVAPPPVLDDIFGGFWPDKGVPGRIGVVLAALGAGVLAGILIPYHSNGIGVMVALLVAGVVVVLATPKRRTRFRITCYALCVLLLLPMMLRDAGWIIALCLFTAIGTVLISATDARTLIGYGLTGVSWPLAGLRGLPWFGRTLSRVSGLGRSAAVVRTVIFSVLGLVIFGVLFSTADALLGTWVQDVLPHITMGTIVFRVFVTVFVFGAVLAAAYLALNPPRVERGSGEVRPVANRYEWLVPVLVVDAVFVVFLIAQATAAFGGHAYLERTTGLTYAEYVHQGFGQLTVATALTLLVIWAAARKAPVATSSDRLWLRGALGLLGVAALVVVASALYRMHLYQEAYGFTRLRLVVDVFEGWLGVLVVAGFVAGVVLRGSWLERFALVTGAIGLLGIAAINPDGWIASRNIDRYEATHKIDTAYLGGLSQDAVPALRRLPADVRRCVLTPRESHDTWLDWNLGRARAGGMAPIIKVTGESGQCEPRN
ncbi:MAG: DUF4173 domain-containing protein [Nocardioides sp.]|nr:DUF4173 domain-containing protein [Nocardioides sp.]